MIRCILRPPHLQLQHVQRLRAERGREVACDTGHRHSLTEAQVVLIPECRSDSREVGESRAEIHSRICGQQAWRVSELATAAQVVDSVKLMDTRWWRHREGLAAYLQVGVRTQSADVHGPRADAATGWRHMCIL